MPSLEARSSLESGFGLVPRFPTERPEYCSSPSRDPSDRRLPVLSSTTRKKHANKLVRVNADDSSQTRWNVSTHQRRGTGSRCRVNGPLGPALPDFPSLPSAGTPSRPGLAQLRPWLHAGCHSARSSSDPPISGPPPLHPPCFIFFLTPVATWRIVHIAILFYRLLPFIGLQTPEAGTITRFPAERCGRVVFS